MLFMKVGRNEPCPCGSGKKYKHCCLGSKVIPFPGAADNTDGAGRASSVDADYSAKMFCYSCADDFDRAAGEYEAYCESLPEGAHIPSFNEYFGRANAATATMADINADLNGMNFESKKSSMPF